jgi:hypothetical protein
MERQYGFYTEQYGDTFSIETLMTGDGKAEFTCIGYDDGTVSIGISYGQGDGIGAVKHYNHAASEEMGIKWQIKFDNQQSVNAMINSLLDVKERLAQLDQLRNKEQENL